MKNQKKNILDINQAKGAKKLACATAYDFTMARLLSSQDMDIILVGDSLGMEVQGQSSTVYVTLEQMAYHCQCVARGNETAFLVGDMPFLTAEESPEATLRNGGKLVQEGKVDALKIEGGQEKYKTIQKLTQAGIPVMGHIGLTPQKILNLGKYKVQGKDTETEKKILEDAQSVQEAGAFSIVLECLPKELAQRITENLKIPTIGIGAGPFCDGQILVTNDLLGINNRFKPKFVKQFKNLWQDMEAGVKSYIQEVREGQFPDTEHSY